MKTSGKVFIILLLMIFSASCCGKQQLKTSFNGDHPLEPTTSYFIYQRVMMKHPIFPQIVEVGAMSGSGVAVRGSNKYTDIITAGHVCTMPAELEAMGAQQVINLFDIYGEQFVG